MKSFFDKILKSISEFFSKLEKKEKIRLIVLLVVIVGLSVAVAAVLNRTTYSTLYSGDAATAGEIITELNSLGISYKTEGAGTILVPEDQVNETRMNLASMGYLSDSLDYSLFSSSDGFGSSSLREQTLLNYQTATSLQTVINKLEKIKASYVILNLPEQSSFVISQNDSAGSASVTVELASGVSTLTDADANTIAEIVASSTSIPVENVRIMDDNANLYTSSGSAGDATSLAYQLELENQVRASLETQVETLLETVFGSGKVKTAVSVTLNFDDETVQSVEFAPPVEGETEGLVVSMYELYKYTLDETAEGVVGTDSNGVGTVEYPYDDETGVYYREIVKETNYEINETVTNITKAKATIKNLSIAVLIDSLALETDYSEQVQQLVVNAIGVNENYISVARMPFQEDNSLDEALEEQQAVLRSMRMTAVIELVIKGIIILLLVLAILVFLKTVIGGFKREEPTLITAGAYMGEAGEGIDYVAGDDDIEEIYEDVNLSTKTEGVSQLERFIDKDSQAIAQLLRNWLSDEE